MFNVALQVGGSVVGLAGLTALAQGVEERYGDGRMIVGEAGYRGVYYGCLGLCVVGLVVGAFGVDVPEGIGGGGGIVWERGRRVEGGGEEEGDDGAASSHELRPVSSR